MALGKEGPMLEVTIDGTNFGGKTVLVDTLLAKLSSVKTFVSNPFKELDVYSLWPTQPIEAARRIFRYMERLREQQEKTDVLIWDRGWPTIYMATRSVSARVLFPPTEPTFLLLNTRETLNKKLKKYGLTKDKFPWMHGPTLPDETSYEELAEQFKDQTKVFRPDENGLFDLSGLSDTIALTISNAGVKL
jgi:hypothetical protein